MPEGLVEVAHSRDMVIFAGAGVSTETPAVFSQTFYADITQDLQLSDSDDLDFPTVMQQYEDKYSRTELVGKLRRRFDYADSFYRLRYQARKFHRELSTMPYIEDIITTNWDTYFEEECAATPFVHGEDFAFVDVSPRRVFKLHGSVTSLASLVITQSDYQRRLDQLRTNLLGSRISQLLGTKTVVFIGYSLRDWNFRLLYEAVRTDIGAFAPKAYVISPFEINEEELYPGLTHIRTSGVAFLRELKAKLADQWCFLSDDGYGAVAEALEAAVEAHAIATSQYSHEDYPAILHCWSYQQGLIDALRRMLDRRLTGEYSQRYHILSLTDSYDKMSKEQLSAGHYWDAAYLRGYANGIVVRLTDEELDLASGVPLYFMYGTKPPIHTEVQFLNALTASQFKAPKARLEAAKLNESIPADMIATRAPFLPMPVKGEESEAHAHTETSRTTQASSGK